MNNYSSPEYHENNIKELNNELNEEDAFKLFDSIIEELVNELKDKNDKKNKNKS